MPTRQRVSRNRTNLLRSLLAALAASSLLLWAGNGRTAELTWDADPATTGAQDGSGNWNTTTPNWISESANVTWADGGDAVFGAGGSGTATVTLAESILARYLTFNPGAIYTLDAQDGHTLTRAGGEQNVVVNAAEARIDAPMVGHHLRKRGSGTLILTGDNTMTGYLDVHAGVVNLRNGNALGEGNIHIVSTTSALEVQDNITVNNRLIIRGHGVNGTGSLRSRSGDNTWAGNIEEIDGSHSSIGVDSGSSLTVTGSIRHYGTNRGYLTKVGGGALILAGDNSDFTRHMDVAAGVVRLTHADGVPGDYFHVRNAGATVELAGGISVPADKILYLSGGAASPDVATFHSASGHNVWNGEVRLHNDEGNRNIGVAAGSSLTLAGVVSQSGSNRNLVKIGDGTLVLSGTTSYTGGTTVREGVLAVASGIALPGPVLATGDGSLTIEPAGVLSITGSHDLRLQGNATLNLHGTLRRTSGPNWFRLGDGSGQDVTINHSDTGTLESTSAANIAFNQFSGSGQATYNMTGGTFTTTSYMALGWSYESNTGDMIGTFNQSGASVVNVGESVRLGLTAGNNTTAAGAGYYNISDGVLNAPAIEVGAWDSHARRNGASTGVFTQTGGTVGGTTRPDVFIARGAPSTGTYVLRGGVLNARDLSDGGVGAASILNIQGGAGTIDVSRAFSFTGANSTLAVEVGATGLTPIQVSGTGTANVGATTNLTGSVYGGAALNPNDTFPVLQLASGSIAGSFVDDSGPLWTLSQTSDHVDLALADGAGKGTVAVGSAVTELDDAFGWLSVVAGGFGPGLFPMEMRLGGSGSVTDLADWMGEAGLDATADSARNMITLADLPVPTGAPSYFFWDLTDYNAAFGTTFAVTGITAVPEPSALILAAIGAVALAFRRRPAGRHKGSHRRTT